MEAKMKKITILCLTILFAVVFLSGCMDMKSENNNYNGVYPLSADLNGDGIITPEEAAAWNARNIE